MWPDSPSGLWCCRPWCYVSNLCTHPDVSTSTQTPGFFYSYITCEGTVTAYDDESCPYTGDFSFDVSFATIFIAEHMGSLKAHEEAISSFAIASVDGVELMISGGDDGLMCVSELQSYGGTLSSCTLPMRRAIKALAAGEGWVVTATAGEDILSL